MFKMIATGRPPVGTAGPVRVPRRRARRSGPEGGGPSSGPPKPSTKRSPETSGGSSSNCSLKRTPPLAAVALLSREGIGLDDLLLCTETDIDSDGAYRGQWLAVTNDRLLVCSAGDVARLDASVRFADVSEFRCEGVIGSGLLQARVDGLYVDLLRYSTSWPTGSARSPASSTGISRASRSRSTPKTTSMPAAASRAG